VILFSIPLPPEYLDARPKLVNSKLFGNSYLFFFVVILTPPFVLLFRIEAFYLSTPENKVPIEGSTFNSQEASKYF
jgi:hypothetical protein